MSEWKVVIADDEPLACKRISKLLEPHAKFNVVQICQNGPSALQAIESHHPDVVFLDIEMPGLTGIELVRRLPEESRPLIVFTTAYNQYAIEAFNIFALDYLLKPFTEERFDQTMKRISTVIKKERVAEWGKRIQFYLQYMQGDTQANYGKEDKIKVSLGNRIFFVKIAEIQYITASGNYVNIHMGKTRHILRETLNAYEKKLAQYGFIRIHKSHLINPEYLMEIHKSQSGNQSVRMSDGSCLNIGKSYRKRFYEQMS